MDFHPMSLDLPNSYFRQINIVDVDTQERGKGVGEKKKDTWVFLGTSSRLSSGSSFSLSSPPLSSSL